MSWSIKSIGALAAVRLEVQNSNLPDALKNMAFEILDEPTPAGYIPQDGAIVSGSGHFGGGCPGNVQKFTIEKFKLAALPALPETPAVIATAPVEAQPIVDGQGENVAPGPAAADSAPDGS